MIWQHRRVCSCLENCRSQKNEDSGAEAELAKPGQDDHDTDADPEPVDVEGDKGAEDNGAEAELAKLAQDDQDTDVWCSQSAYDWQSCLVWTRLCTSATSRLSRWSQCLRAFRRSLGVPWVGPSSTVHKCEMLYTRRVILAAIMPRGSVTLQTSRSSCKCKGPRCLLALRAKSWLSRMFDSFVLFSDLLV